MCCVLILCWSLKVGTLVNNDRVKSNILVDEASEETGSWSHFYREADRFSLDFE